MIHREKENPIIKKESILPSSKDFEIIGAFNAGAITFGEETILLIRVAEKAIQHGDGFICPVFNNDLGGISTIHFKPEQIDDISDPRTILVEDKKYLTSISHLHIARSKDGVHFTIDEKPFMMPENEYEAFGIEDARITLLEGHYYITYSSLSSLGAVAGLAVTDDFISVERMGIMFHPDNKDVVIFNEKINGKYYALHRPSTSVFAKPEIWIAESLDMKCFGMHRFVAGVRPGKWDCARIGAGAPPFLTEKGWIEIYHGATEENRYCMGVMLLDKNEPWKVLARSEEPLIEPETPYELDGFFGNVVFGCGSTQHDNIVNLYYGASDDSVAVISMTIQDIYDHLGI